MLVLYICSTVVGIGIYEAEMSRRWWAVGCLAFCGSVGGRGHAEPRPPGLSQPFGSYLCITMQLVRDPRKRKVARLIVHFCSILAAGLEDCTRDLWQAGLFFEGASNDQGLRPQKQKVT